MTNFLLVFVLIPLLSHSLSLVLSLDLGCRNEDGNIVDWYYLYKLPKGPAGEHEKSDGLEYIYITSDSTPATWQTTNIKIDSAQSIAGQTITPLYSRTVSDPSFSYELN